MSDEKKPAEEKKADATPAAPPVDPVLKLKFDGKEMPFDLSKPEDRQKLATSAQLGLLSERQNTQINDLKAKLSAAEADPDAKVGRELREWIARDPAGGSLVAQLVDGLRNGRMDPNQIRSALAARESGDAAGLEAQARATVDPQTRVLLNQMAATLQGVQRETGELRSTLAKKDQEALVRGALGAEPWLVARPAAFRQAQRRTSEMLAEGMSVDQATILAIQEQRDVVNESANVEANRLKDQKELATVKPSSGLPPLSEHVAKNVDPKASPQVQKKQRLAALQDRFRATLNNVAEGLMQ